MVSRRIAIALAAICTLNAAALAAGPVVILLGPPGSGKSTQAKAIAARHKLQIIASEDLIARNPDAFKREKAVGLTGMLPRTDPVLNKLFEAQLSASAVESGLVLDGYPATNDHFNFVKKLVTDGKLPKPVVLKLDLADEKVRKRLKGKPGYDTATLDQLLKDYHRETDMVQLYFPEAPVYQIDASKSASKVTKEINKLLDPLIKKR